MDNEQTQFSNRFSTKRYYTEHVRISTDEGTENELVPAYINEKRQLVQVR